MQIKNIVLLCWIISLANLVLGQQEAGYPIADTSVNSIKLNLYASTEKVLGNKVGEKEFEANGMLPRIEIVNRDSTQVLRLFFHYGGSRNSVDEFEILAIDKSYRLPKEAVAMDIDVFTTSKNITLFVKKDSIVKKLGGNYKLVDKGKGFEQLYYEIKNPSGFLKRYSQYKYYIRCTFEKGCLIKYSFGFEYA